MHGYVSAMDQDKKSAPTLRVGCTATGRDRKRYFSSYTALEYGRTFIFPPRAPTLGRLRAQLPEGLVPTVRAWQVITHQADCPTYKNLPREILGDPAGFGNFADTPEVENALRNTVRAARRLGAWGIVFSTPAAFTPTAGNRKNLDIFFGELAPREDHGLRLIWEPAGLWSTDEVQGICSDLSILPCWDPLARQAFPDAEEAYLRVTNMGQPRPPGTSDLLDLAEGLRRYKQATCIFATPSMFTDAQRLTELL